MTNCLQPGRKSDKELIYITSKSLQCSVAAAELRDRCYELGKENRTKNAIHSFS